MRRKTFDALLSTGGLVVAAVLIVAGALGLWAHSFANSNVHDQLAQQKVFFPNAAGIAAQNNAEITKYVTPYAGQQVVNGQQAEVFPTTTSRCISPRSPVGRRTARSRRSS
jgi:hypothetical protein